LEANRTRLLADAMREHFGDTAEAPRLLFIPFAAADGDYDAYVKRTIELVRCVVGGSRFLDLLVGPVCRLIYPLLLQFQWRLTCLCDLSVY